MEITSERGVHIRYLMQRGGALVIGDLNADAYRARQRRLVLQQQRHIRHRARLSA